MPTSVPGDFNQILPTTVTDAAVRSGNEWVVPLPHLIAVLGVESFRILDNGLGVEGYTGYAFDFQGNWPAFVAENNTAALRFIGENPPGHGYGYILTTSSQDEFENLRDRL